MLDKFQETNFSIFACERTQSRTANDNDSMCFDSLSNDNRLIGCNCNRRLHLARRSLHFTPFQYKDVSLATLTMKEYFDSIEKFTRISLENGSFCDVCVCVHIVVVSDVQTYFLQQKRTSENGGDRTDKSGKREISMYMCREEKTTETETKQNRGSNEKKSEHLKNNVVYLFKVSQQWMHDLFFVFRSSGFRSLCGY